MLRNLFGRKRSVANVSTGAPAPSPAPASGGALAQPTDVTDATFDAAILSCPQLALVDFWADWCAPCTTMSAYVSFLAADYAAQLTVAALDVDENPATAERYGVMGLPTLLFLSHGAEVDRIVGLVPYEDLKRVVERLLAGHPAAHPPADPAVNSAEVHDASL